jgi:hypothetical protein
MKMILILTVLMIATSCSSKKLMRCPEHVEGDFYWCEKP